MSLLTTAAALALLLLPAVMAPPALALPLPAPVKCPDLLLNTGTTGWDANQPFAVNAHSLADPKWILASGGPAVSTSDYPGWQANDGFETWITPLPNYDAVTEQAIGAPAGTYDYVYTFFLPGGLGLPPPCGETTLRICFAADNRATLWLNTLVIGSTLTSPTVNHGFKAWSCVYQTSGWIYGGINTVRAEVVNIGGPTGFIAYGVLDL